MGPSTGTSRRPGPGKGRARRLSGTIRTRCRGSLTTSCIGRIAPGPLAGLTTAQVSTSSAQAEGLEAVATSGTATCLEAKGPTSHSRLRRRATLCRAGRRTTAKKEEARTPSSGEKVRDGKNGVSAAAAERT